MNPETDMPAKPRPSSPTELHRQALLQLFGNLLAAHDRALAMLRMNWMGAVSRKDLKGQADWLTRINEGLDERLVVMRQRDEAAATEVPR